MNTPTHLLLGLAAFGRPGQRAVTWAAGLGAIAPDASLYVMAGVSLRVLNIPPNVVFNELYYSDAWQTVFAIDNSILLWGAVLLAGWWIGSAVLKAFAGAALLHIALDFPLHAGDGRPHFWPLSRWVYDSPVSYWDSAHHANLVAPVAVVISVVAGITIWRRWQNWAMRSLAVLLLAAEIWVARQWILFF